MELREVTMTNFVLLQETWTSVTCYELLKHLQPARVILSQEKGQYTLFEAAYLEQLFARTASTVSVAEVLAGTPYQAVPALENDSVAEEIPDQCIILEDGYPLGFFDIDLLADLEAIRNGVRGSRQGDNQTDGPAFDLSSLIVDVPPTIAYNSVVSVLISISAESVIDAQNVRPLDVPPETVVDIIVSARRGLVFEGEVEGQLTTPREGETSSLRFLLRGVEPGPGKFMVRAFHNREHLNTLPVEIQVLQPVEHSDAETSQQQHSTTYPLEPITPYDPGLPLLTFERQLAGKKAITPPLKRQYNQQGTGTASASATTADAPHLHIMWEKSEPEHLLHGIPINQDRGAHSTRAEVKKLVGELEALLTHLFVETDAIVVSPLSPGFSGTRVLKVQPCLIGSGGGAFFVIKFGAIQLIEQEYANYQRYVFFYNNSGRFTAAFRYEQTAHLGAILYGLAGGDFRDTHDFGVVYQKWDYKKIEEILDNLFYKTCERWYKNSQPLYPLNLTMTYQQQSAVSAKQLEKDVKKLLPMVRFQQTLTFTSLEKEPARTFPNPFPILKAGHSLNRYVYTTITHGDLNQRNILVDHLGYPWLIDFQSTGPSHILRDVATLDAVTRFQLLAPNQATLDEFLAIEETLYAAQRFQQLEDLPVSPAIDNPALIKAYQTVLYLRKMARLLLRDQPQGQEEKDMDEYYIALFYIALETLQYSSLAPRQHERALLSASLLVERLGLI
jgi:hypothetical protein